MLLGEICRHWWHFFGRGCSLWFPRLQCQVLYIFHAGKFVNIFLPKQKLDIIHFALVFCIVPIIFHNLSNTLICFKGLGIKKDFGSIRFHEASGFNRQFVKTISLLYFWIAGVLFSRNGVFWAEDSSQLVSEYWPSSEDVGHRPVWKASLAQLYLPWILCRSTSVRKIMAQEYPDIVHQFDIW